MWPSVLFWDSRVALVPISFMACQDFQLKEYLGISMLVANKDYLFASKLLALTSRKEVAMRDIYDIHYFSKNNWGVDDEVIKEKTGKKITFIIFFLLLSALSARTVTRNIDWKNQDNLWLSASRTSPSSHQNHNNLGDMYARQGNFQKAIEEFQKAIELKPDYGDAYHNLANVYHQIQKDDLALENYQKALSFNPNLWQSYQNIAAIYFTQQKFDLAKEFMEKAIKINPENIDLHTNFGILYLNIKDEQKAKEEFEKALQIDPQNQKAKSLLESLKNSDKINEK